MRKGSLLNCSRILFVAYLFLVALLISPAWTLIIDHRNVNTNNLNSGSTSNRVDGIDRVSFQQRIALESPNIVSSNFTAMNSTQTTLERATSTTQQSAGALAALIIAPIIMIGLTLIIIIFIAIFMIYARRKEVLNRKTSLHNDIVNTNKVEVVIDQGL